MGSTSDTEIKPSIESLIQEIETRAKKADDHVVAAALRLRELRQRIEGGELGETVKWTEWARTNFRKLSPSRLYELSAIAEADDPHAELERQRRNNREKVKKFREKKAAAKRALERERRDMIEWAKSAALADVQKIWAQIGRMQDVSSLLPKFQEAAPRERVH